MRGESTRLSPAHLRPSCRAVSVLALAVAVVVSISGASGLAAPPPATTLYVDQTNPDCSDGGAGSAILPFCTITAAARRAVGGQTVVVAAGTYTEDVTPSSSGTSTAPIVFTVVPGAIVTVTGKANGFTLSNKSWITVRGFNVTGTIKDGISVSGSANITLTGNHVSYCGQPVSGLTGCGIRLSATASSLVADNTVDHNSDFGIFLTNGTTDVTVAGNDVSYNARGFERAAAGIHAYASTGNLFDGNVSHDNEDSGIDCSGGANDNLIRNNVSYRNGDHGIGVFGSTGTRIVANSVYRNVTAGIAIYGSSGGATLANNISVDNGINSPRTTGNIRVDPTSTTGTMLDYDVVFLHEASSVIIWGSTTYYSLAAFVTDTGQELHGIEADPKWSSPDTGDLHLLKGSPAIDSANSGAIGQSESDAGGNARVDDPNTPDTGAGPRPDADRGAFEFLPNGACGHAGAAGCPVTDEICGDCIDNDGDGLVDYEDPDCCAQASLLGLQKMRVRPPRSKGRRLALKALYLRSVQPDFDPTAQDTTLQVADSHGELFCKTIAAANWKRRAGGHLFRFRDPEGRFAGGLAAGRFRVKRNGKVMFSTRGRKTLEMRGTEDRTLNLAVRVGGVCMQTTAALRSDHKGLVFP